MASVNFTQVWSDRIYSHVCGLALKWIKNEARPKGSGVGLLLFWNVQWKNTVGEKESERERERDTRWRKRQKIVRENIASLCKKSVIAWGKAYKHIYIIL